MDDEAFRVLKNKDEKQFGDYRTRRLVLEAWERLDAHGLMPEAYGMRQSDIVSTGQSEMT